VWRQEQTKITVCGHKRKTSNTIEQTETTVTRLNEDSPDEVLMLKSKSTRVDRGDCEWAQEDP
jgi:hypothetical protein